MGAGDSSAIVETVAQVDLSYLEKPLAADIRRSLEKGLASDCCFDELGGADEIFQASVQRAIRAIEAKDRYALLPRFLVKGPYFKPGPIPASSKSKYLPDDEVAAAIRFIHGSAINSFQGALAELLAVGPVCEIATRAFGKNAPRIFAGDSVWARKASRSGWGKAADFHLLGVRASGEHSEVVVHGVAEVKSYITTPEKLRGQVRQHLNRLRGGLRFGDRQVPLERLRMGVTGNPVIEIYIVPSDWALSREVRLERDGERTFLAQHPTNPPAALDQITELGKGCWLVVLRWSQEALASVAHEMTFWYMGQLGRMLYERDMPKEWEGMTAEEAGRNAAKMMLYYAILRARTVREESRAISLYNTYGFGYALGSNFVDKDGRRRELFFEDLQELAAGGRSRTRPIEVRDKRGRLQRVIPPLFCRVRV